MRRHLRSPRVGGFNRGREFGASEKVVALEIVHALVKPKIDRLRCVLRPSQLMRLQHPTALAFKIRASDVDLRPRHFSGVDLLLNLQIGIGLERASGPNRGHAAGQIEPRKAIRHLAINSIAHRIEHVVMHPNQAGDDRVTLQAENLCVFGHTRGRDASLKP